MVDCCGSKYGNAGCNGGDENVAMTWAKTHPMMLESDYAYTAADDTCT